MMKLLDRGGCAEVFEMPQGRVLKAFRRRHHTNGIVTDWTDWTDHDAIKRAQFRAEALAYEKLQGHAPLEIYVPRYYGRVDPTQLQFPDDKQIYVPGCGLIIEMIPGKAKKMAHLEKSQEEQVAEVMKQIRDSLGLDQVRDGSFFFPGARAAFTVIDFALWNAEDYEKPLYETAASTGTYAARARECRLTKRSRRR